MKNYSKTLLTEINRIPQKASIVVGQEVISRPEQGVGINITLDHQAGGSYPESDQGWQQVLDNLSWLSPNWLCITLPVEELINVDGSVNREAAVLERFSYFCRWAEEREADIVLMFPKSVPSWLRFKGLSSHSPAPADLDIYAGIICNALGYFVQELGYNRLKYLTIFGEPFNQDGEDFTFATPGSIDPYLYYVKMHQVVGEALDSKGLANVGLMGLNSADVYAHMETLERMKERKADLSSYIAAIDLHSYRMRFDYLPPSHHIPTCTMTEYVNDYLQPAIMSAKARDKPCFITELGCMYYGKSNYGDNRGPSRHEAFIAEAELILHGLNLGMDGFLKWVYMFNTEESRGHYHLLEQAKSNYDQKDNYYGYAALCRHLPKGAGVLKTEITTEASSLCVAAIEDGKSGSSIFLVNDHPANMFDVEISLDGLAGNRFFRKFVVDYWDKYSDKGTIKATDGTISTRITPLSLTVLACCSEDDYEGYILRGSPKEQSL